MSTTSFGAEITEARIWKIAYISSQRTFRPSTGLTGLKSSTTVCFSNWWYLRTSGDFVRSDSRFEASLKDFMCATCRASLSILRFFIVNPPGALELVDLGRRGNGCGRVSSLYRPSKARMFCKRSIPLSAGLLYGPEGVDWESTRYSYRERNSTYMDRYTDLRREKLVANPEGGQKPWLSI